MNLMNQIFIYDSTYLTYLFLLSSNDTNFHLAQSGLSDDNKLFVSFVLFDDSLSFFCNQIVKILVSIGPQLISIGIGARRILIFFIRDISLLL